jgi:arylsulfatase A-like enzyme
MNGRPRILLADDHTMLLDAFRRLLEPRCEIVGTACDGRALINLAVSTRPDVIVLDIAMPRLDGIEAARQLRRSHQHVRLVFLTVHEDADFAQAAHGFDEYFGYLYHLNAMEDPFYYTYPPEWKSTVGPRNLIHSWATDTDDPTVEPRWGKVGKQKIVDEGPLPPNPIEGIKYNMETFDEVITESTISFMNKAKEEGKPFFVWMNPTRAHVLTHLSPKYDAMRTPETDFGLEEAALKQLDDNVGVVLNWLKENGLDENTIVVFTTDNGAEVYTWPDGGTTPFAGAKGEVTEGSFRVPAIIRWPGHVKPGSVSNGIMSGLDWFPTLVTAAGNPDITNELLKGKPLGEQTYKVHLDGYDQTDLLTGQGPSKRHEVWYFAQTQLGALRMDNYKYQFVEQPEGWIGPIVRPNMPILTNLRQDPFERMN